MIVKEVMERLYLDFFAQEGARFRSNRDFYVREIVTILDQPIYQIGDLLISLDSIIGKGATMGAYYMLMALKRFAEGDRELELWFRERLRSPSRHFCTLQEEAYRSDSFAYAHETRKLILENCPFLPNHIMVLSLIMRGSEESEGFRNGVIFMLEFIRRSEEKVD